MSKRPQLMARTQIYLTHEQLASLTVLAASLGRRRSDLCRKAIEAYLASSAIQEELSRLGPQLDDAMSAIAQRSFPLL